VKHALATATCAALLLGSLTACGSSDSKSTLPAYTGGSTPSATTTQPPTTAPTATRSGPAPLLEHTTYTYGGLKVVVNLPANIPAESRPSMILASDFFQGVGKTMAENTLDPSLTKLASPKVVKYIGGAVVPGSVQAIGSLIFTIRQVQTVVGASTRATVCVDQSKVIQVRKDGSHFLDVDNKGKRIPMLKMTGTISQGMTIPQMTRLTSVAEAC